MSLPFHPQPKPLPRVADKKLAKRGEQSAIRSVYALVDQRDKRTCRVCGSKVGIEHHHRIPRSRGGKHTTDNLMCADRLCHRLMQQYRILVEGETCDGPLVFAMRASIGAVVFKHRAIPAHVRIEDIPRD